MKMSKNPVSWTRSNDGLLWVAQDGNNDLLVGFDGEKYRYVWTVGSNGTVIAQGVASVKDGAGLYFAQDQALLASRGE